MRLILFALFFVLFQDGFSQIQVNISADKTTCRVNEVLTITVEVSSSGNPNLPKAELPVPAGVKRISGQSSSGQSISIVNGQYQVSVTETHVFMAQKTGPLTIGPAVLKSGGQTIKSNTLSINVVAADAKMEQNPSGEDEPVFIRATVSNPSPVVGEPVYVKFRLYFRTRINNPRQIQDFAVSGALTEDVNTSMPNQRPQNEVVNGITYSAVNIREAVVYPQKHGTIDIQPLVINVQAARQRKSGRSSIFDDFLMDPFQEYTNINVTSNSVKLKVRSPGTLPADYTGFVGSVNGTRTVSKTTTEVNQSVSVILTFEGSGNFKNFLPPSLTFSNQVEVYPPKETTKMNAGPKGGIGTYSVEYIIIPRYSGDIVLPAQTWSWYDLSAGRIKTNTFDPVTISVTGGVQPGTYMAGEQYDFRAIGKDISFIRTHADWQARESFFSNPALPAAGGILLIWAGVLAWAGISYKQNRERSDYKNFAYRNAEKFAKHSLAQARKMAEIADLKAVLGEIQRVFNQFLARKLKQSESVWTVEEVIRILKDKQVDEVVYSRIESYLKKLNEYRFAPVQLINESKGELIQHAEQILADLSAHWPE